MEKERKKQKMNERGITLIALVITIIVLLILAGVSIATLTGENGLLNQAVNSKEQNEIAEVKERAELAKQGVLSEDLADGKETVREDIINAIVQEVGGSAEGNLITTEDGKYEIMVKGDNSIEVVEKGQGYIDAEYKEASPSTDFEYTIDEENNTVTITEYIGTDTVVNIPETIEGKTVTKIEMGAFAMKNLQSVKIPNTIQSIGDFAFYDNQLTDIDIPKSVTNITWRAFNENKINEKQAYIYKRTSTGEEDKTTLISYGGNKKDIIIPETVETIDAFAFNEVTSIESLVIGDNVTTVGLSSVANCKNLKKVVIGKNVTRLKRGAFMGDPQLTDVEFKGDVPNFSYVGSGDTGEAGDGSVSGSTSVGSGMIFTYNENLRIKVPKGKLEDYKTAKVTLNGEEYFNTLETWFFAIGYDESWLDVFYE